MCITCGLAAAFLAACGGLIGDSPNYAWHLGKGVLFRNRADKDFS